MLWQLYNEVRNLYSHTHGILVRKLKDKINSKTHELKVFFNASTISLLIFWGVQMLFYISIYYFVLAGKIVKEFWVAHIRLGGDIPQGYLVNGLAAYAALESH